MRKVPPILKPIALLTISVVVATATGVVNSSSYRQPTKTEPTTGVSGGKDKTTPSQESGQTSPSAGQSNNEQSAASDQASQTTQDQPKQSSEETDNSSTPATVESSTPAKTEDDTQQDNETPTKDDAASVKDSGNLQGAAENKTNQAN